MYHLVACTHALHQELCLNHRFLAVSAGLQDLTLPLISLFTGQGFDKVVRETFANGPQNIEDLWLK